MTTTRSAIAYAVVFVALWAAVEALAGRMLTEYSPYQVVWTRYVVHLAFMVAVWGWREPRALWHTRRLGYQVARSLLMLVMPASWVIAQQHGVATQTTLSVFWLSPLMILGLSALVLRERAPAAAWIACVIAFATVVLALKPVSVPITNLVFPLGMTASFSLYVIMTRSLRTEDLRANLFYTALGVALALTPVMAWTFVIPTLRDLAAMVGVGLLGFVGLYALDRMAAYAPVHATAPVVNLQLAFAIGLGAIVHGNLPALRSLAAIAIIGSVAIVVWAWQPTQEAT